MVTLRATPIMKTDISGSTVRFRSLLQPDLKALLSEHREFVGRLAAAQDGRIVKAEGDGFWLVFPSVTAAALAAIAMQEELRLAEGFKGDSRLAMRIVITLGDVLHDEGELMGDAVVLAARIEALTPANEIYLSAAAWLAVNHAEVHTGLVDAFTLKGFAGPVPIYRVDQAYRTQVIADQYIVVTDLRGFTALVETLPMTEVEAILDRLHELVGELCREFNGTIRFSGGDSYYLTFPEGELAIAAVERLMEEWSAPLSRGSRPPMSVAVHRGMLYAYRDFLHSTDITITAAVERFVSRMSPDNTAAFVTGQVRDELLRSYGDERFERVEVRPRVPGLGDLQVFRLRVC